MIPGYGFYRVYHKFHLTELELSCGAKWVYPRLGQNHWDDWSEPDLVALQAPFQGNVCGWMWIDPSTSAHATTLSTIRRIAATNLMKALTLDIEDSWSHVRYDVAKQHFLEIRNHAPNLTIGYCPVDTVGYRSGSLDEAYFAASEIFDFCDVQDYPWEHSDAGADYWHKIWEAQWALLERRHPSMSHASRRPLAGTYRPRTRGGKLVSPMTEPMHARLIADVRVHRTKHPNAPLFTSDAMDPAVAKALQEDYKNSVVK